MLIKIIIFFLFNFNWALALSPTKVKLIEWPPQIDHGNIKAVTSHLKAIQKSNGHELFIIHVKNTQVEPALVEEIAQELLKLQRPVVLYFTVQDKMLSPSQWLLALAAPASSTYHYNSLAPLSTKATNEKDKEKFQALFLDIAQKRNLPKEIIEQLIKKEEPIEVAKAYEWGAINFPALSEKEIPARIRYRNDNNLQSFRSPIIFATRLGQNSEWETETIRTETQDLFSLELIQKWALVLMAFIAMTMARQFFWAIGPAKSGAVKPFKVMALFAFFAINFFSFMLTNSILAVETMFLAAMLSWIFAFFRGKMLFALAALIPYYISIVEILDPPFAFSHGLSKMGLIASVLFLFSMIMDKFGFNTTQIHSHSGKNPKEASHSSHDSSLAIKQQATLIQKDNKSLADDLNVDVWGNKK